MTSPPDANHVRQSIDAASSALQHLERSLRQGGFAEGAAAYERMADVLIAQRVFIAEGDADVGARFDQLGMAARRIFELLNPYTSAMRKLSVLAPDTPSSDASAAILKQLERRGRRGASASVLARATRTSAAKVERALAMLTQEGKVITRKTGGVTSYALPQPTSPSRRSRK